MTDKGDAGSGMCRRKVYLDYYPERADQGVTELQVAVVKD
jgi:hypothetical protein